MTDRDSSGFLGHLRIIRRLMAPIENRRLGLYIGILVGFAVMLTVAARIFDTTPVALAPAYMFTPLVAGLIVAWRYDIPPTAIGLRLGRGRWLAVAGITALPLVGLTLALAIAVPGVGFEPTDPLPGMNLPGGPVGLLATLAIVLGLGTTVNAVFALGEEVGWRGYLLWELAPLGFWRASAGIGGLWGLWHAPVIVAGYNYPSFPVVGVATMTVATLAYSPVYTYLVVRAESVLAAAFLHGVFNASAGAVIVFAVTDDAVLNELVASPVGAAGIVAFGLAALAIALVGPPTLSRSRLDGGPSTLE